MNTNTDWQLMDTAPKDGTQILACGRGTERMIWDDNQETPLIHAVIRWSWIDDYSEVPSEGGLYKKVPCRILERWYPYGLSWFRPIYWMPLPKPPETLSPDYPVTSNPDPQANQPSRA